MSATPIVAVGQLVVIIDVLKQVMLVDNMLVK
jgi:hypothetical protein